MNSFCGSLWRRRKQNKKICWNRKRLILIVFTLLLSFCLARRSIVGGAIKTDSNIHWKISPTDIHENSLSNLFTCCVCVCFSFQLYKQRKRNHRMRLNFMDTVFLFIRHVPEFIETFCYISLSLCSLLHQRHNTKNNNLQCYDLIKIQTINGRKTGINNKWISILVFWPPMDCYVYDDWRLTTYKCLQKNRSIKSVINIITKKKMEKK